MAHDGYLIAAGPLDQSPDLRGVVIFKGISVERARELASQDPAVINKRLRVHVENWTGTKGIGAEITNNLKDPNYKFKMTRYGFLVSWLTPEAPKDWSSPEAKVKRKQQADWFAANASKLAGFGSFVDAKEFSNVAVFRSTDLDEIGKLIATEPFIKAGWVKPQLLTWFVAEGVMPQQ